MIDPFSAGTFFLSLSLSLILSIFCICVMSVANTWRPTLLHFGSVSELHKARLSPDFDAQNWEKVRSGSNLVELLNTSSTTFEVNQDYLRDYYHFFLSWIGPETRERRKNKTPASSGYLTKNKQERRQQTSKQSPLFESCTSSTHWISRILLASQEIHTWKQLRHVN